MHNEMNEFGDSSAAFRNIPEGLDEEKGPEEDLTREVNRQEITELRDRLVELMSHPQSVNEHPANKSDNLLPGSDRWATQYQKGLFRVSLFMPEPGDDAQVDYEIMITEDVPLDDGSIRLHTSINVPDDLEGAWYYIAQRQYDSAGKFINPFISLEDTVAGIVAASDVNNGPLTLGKYKEALGLLNSLTPEDRITPVN